MTYRSRVAQCIVGSALLLSASAAWSASFDCLASCRWSHPSPIGSVPESTTGKCTSDATKWSDCSAA
ncbi:hypothetical protein BCR61_16580 [Xanthomonas oryzae pv. oryzae]|nr:hypothetical protein B9W05_02600 [Xanthomonas oryzae pv. oryzae]AXI17958.1 hypothetical protein CDO19_13875 [Xanthomonas oryzae pv. oryzae]AXI21102.1 hypothetical protein CDO11_08365 [Xanthomonas oryzae pv. oryzae]AXQ10053.1 hypothetical protein BCR61_16580 [Xanthomonas oryzae pv. oryzae]